MTQTLTLSGKVYRKLLLGAAERGMTIESLLTIFSDLVILPDQPSEGDRARSRRIDSLLDRFRAGQLNAEDRRNLDALIDADYQAANARADSLIGAKQRRSRNGQRAGKKRSRK